MDFQGFPIRIDPKISQKRPGHNPEGCGRHDEEGAQSGNGLTAFAAALLEVSGLAEKSQEIHRKVWENHGTSWDNPL